MGEFTITKGTGFHLALENGIKISTQIGSANYCNNWDKKLTDYPTSENCEVRIIDQDGNNITEEMVKLATGKIIDDIFAGYVTMYDWLKIINVCKAINN